MANKKYDYSEDVQPSAETASEIAKTSEATEVVAEDARRQRLELRNDALANEFRRLKPEIVDAHKKLNDLIDGIGAYSGTMQNLHDMLKLSFPIRFTENDKQALLDEINGIANKAISRIRREHEKADKDMRRNENRISMTQTTFWCMISLLLILATFFVLVIFANMKLLHSAELTEMLVVFSILIVIIFAVVTLVFYKYKH